MLSARTSKPVNKRTRRWIRPQTVHDALLGSLSGVGSQLVTELIVRKTAAQGIQLSVREKQKIAERLARAKSDNLTLRLRRSKKSDSIKIEITPDDVEQLLHQLDLLVESIPTTVLQVIDGLAPHILADLKRRWPKWARRESRLEHSFKSRLARRWKGPLQLLSMLVAICRDLGEDMNATLRAPGGTDRPFASEVVTRLHARACQITSEIIVLLSSGFADGAMARWRSLHEVSVTAFFVSKNGEATAERYLLHEIVESRRAALQYDKYHTRLGEEPLSAQQWAALEEQFRAVIDRFGNPFGTLYGWAAEAIGKERPTFADIEQAIETEFWRPYYKLASYNVHATPKSIFFKLGLVRHSDLLLAGPSNFGLADPGQNAAISLTQVTATLGQLHPTTDTLATLKVLLALVDEIGSSFVNVQRAIEQEETEARTKLTSAASAAALSLN